MGRKSKEKWVVEQVKREIKRRKEYLKKLSDKNSVVYSMITADIGVLERKLEALKGEK